MRRFLILCLAVSSWTYAKEPLVYAQDPPHFARDVLQPMGMPLVSSYHAIRENQFLNAHVKKASGLEAIGDFFLAPSRYLFGGKTVEVTDERITWQPSFRYDRLHWLKTTLALIALPVTEIVGATIKGISYLFPDVRKRQHAIYLQSHSPCVDSQLAYYEQIGIISQPIDETIPCLHYDRPSLLKRRQAIDIGALKEIVALFEQHQILYWIDFGTCLGAYRYGGIIPWDWDIDLSILMPDHHNVKRVLMQLDPQRYQVQDWSSYSYPHTFLKVFVKESGNLIDIMHYRIDEEKKEISYFFTYEHSPFPDAWKNDELRGMKPLAFDVVFPLKRAQFDGVEVLAPHDVVTYLESKYDGNLAPSNLWDPECQCYKKVEDHPYWQTSAAQ